MGFKQGVRIGIVVAMSFAAFISGCKPIQMVNKATHSLPAVTHVPDSLNLPSFYKKYLNANGIPVVS